MPDNSTWAGMIALDNQYHVHCARCERVVEIDMTKMPPEGKAIGATFRCSQCGQKGSPIVSKRSANYSYPGAKPTPRKWILGDGSAGGGGVDR